jgi:glycosyltransferase involved in cell wall biosynthesis
MNPTISIITICFNCKADLRKTLENVAGLNYPNIEHIVIDGGSTDGSIEVIEEFQNQLFYHISEPDLGIYDAMNKGIIVATGAWINFMNAGDTFHNNDVLESIFQSKFLEFDIVYGDTQIHYPNGFSRIKNVEKAGTKVWRRLPFVHQSAMVKAELLKKRPFKIEFPLCADFDFFLHEHLSGAKFLKTDLIISDFYSGGVSDNYRSKTAKEVRQIVRQHKRGFWIELYFLKRIWLANAKAALKKLLPQSTGQFLIKMKYRLANSHPKM